MSVKAKLILGFSILVIFITIGVFTGIFALKTFNDKLGQIVTIHAVKVKASQNMGRIILWLARNEKNAILDTEIEEMNKRYELRKQKLPEMDANFSTITKVMDEQGQERLKNLKSFYDEYLGISEKVFALTLKNQNNEARLLSAGAARQAANKFEETLDAITKRAVEDMDKENQLTTEYYQSTMFFLIALLVFSVAASVGMAIWIIVTINKALNSAVEIASSVSSASQQVSSTSQSLSEGASEQAASIEEISASIEEMSSSVLQNSNAAEETNRIANVSVEEATRGKGSVMKTLDASETSIHQIIYNLCNIAIYAMKKKEIGNLSVRLDKVLILEEMKHFIHSSEFQYVYQIIVRDDGVGIKQTYLDKIFEPFFSTKQNDGGTGLGLASAYGIIQSLKGNISVTSKENVGTRFTIYLPCD